MKTRIRMISAALAAVMVVGAVQGLQQPPTVAGPKENGLAGIKLYDTGVTLINRFGNPDSIQAVGIGGAGMAGGGGAGPGAGGPPGGFGGPPGAGGRAGGGGGMGGSAAEAQMNRPFAFGDDFLREQMQENLRQGRPMMPGGDDEQDVRGRGGIGGPPPGIGAPPGGPGGGGAPGGFGGGNQGGERVTFTRWVYNRGNSRFGFVLDKYNRVIQVEAISVENRSVRTARGITFGATFADIIKKYGAPDGYEISGDRLMVRYLVRDKVAFQLARLEQNKPQRVTGIVVAAGKT